MSSSNYVLYICPTTAEGRAFYTRNAAAYNARPYEERDAGFDLCCANTEFLGFYPCEQIVQRISQNCSAAFYDTERGLFRAFWLLPRSSISRTSLRLANSVGLIDAGYRGTIQAATSWTASHTTGSLSFYVHDGDRYFQLAAPDLLPWSRIEVVETIPGGPTLRGSGGFGSTGVNGNIDTVAAAAAAAAAPVDPSGVPMGGAGVANT